MEMAKYKQLILFDLDGVIVDSRDNMEHAWSEVQIQLGVRTPFKCYFSLIGRPFAEIISRLGLLPQLKEIEEVYSTTSSSNIDLIQFYPDVEKTLLVLVKRGMRLGIVTSKDVFRTSKILTRLPFDFVTIQTPNGIYRGKPAPDHLMAAMAEANVDPDETVYVGDMDSDAEAAARAGIDYVHAKWGYGELTANPFAIALKFSDLPDILYV
jgi:HAD superfamily hydrolase (TIGR01509 family)